MVPKRHSLTCNTVIDIFPTTAMAYFDPPMCTETDVIFSIAHGLPKSCTTLWADRDRRTSTAFQQQTWAERRRQAFVGYENLPHDTEKQPLRVYIHDSDMRDKMRLGKNEFRTLVNCLPMATVCSEARSHAIDFCRAQVKLVNLFYVIDDAPDEASSIGDDNLEHLLVQPTTVMVTSAYSNTVGPEGFDSAEHLVDVVNRVFGSCIERIIFNTWFREFHSLEYLYWPHTVQTGKLEDMYVSVITRLYMLTYKQETHLHW
jgi:hypothetical protein